MLENRRGPPFFWFAGSSLKKVYTFIDFLVVPCRCDHGLAVRREHCPPDIVRHRPLELFLCFSQIPEPNCLIHTLRHERTVYRKGHGTDRKFVAAEHSTFARGNIP